MKLVFEYGTTPDMGGRGYFGIRRNIVRVRNCPMPDVCGRSVSGLTGSNVCSVLCSLMN